MMYICNKKTEDCGTCFHAFAHKWTIKCEMCGVCRVFADKWKDGKKSCLDCDMRNTCKQVKTIEMRGDSYVSLNKMPEGCRHYRSLIVYRKCVKI